MLADEHVARLHVAVDQPAGVRGVEGAGDLGDELDRALRIEWPLPPEDLAQVEAVDVRHREVEHPRVLADGHGRHHVRLVQRGGDLRLAEEPLAEPLVARELRDGHLQRDLPPVGIRGEIHGAPGALTDEPHDPETGDDAAAGQGSGHGASSV